VTGFQPQSGDIFVEEGFYFDLAPEVKADKWDYNYTGATETDGADSCRTTHDSWETIIGRGGDWGNGGVNESKWAVGGRAYSEWKTTG
jgi:hypothetical protein